MFIFNVDVLLGYPALRVDLDGNQGFQVSELVFSFVHVLEWLFGLPGDHIARFYGYIQPVEL